MSFLCMQHATGPDYCRCMLDDCPRVVYPSGNCGVNTVLEGVVYTHISGAHQAQRTSPSNSMSS